MELRLKESKAITLIALVITIIILLILAGVSLRIIFGREGLIENAKMSAFITEFRQIQEKVEIYVNGKMMDKIVGDNFSISNIEILPITTKLNSDEISEIENNNTTLKSKVEELSGKNLEEVNLYWINLEAIDEKVKSNYLIDVDTKQIYKYTGTKIKGKIWHTLDQGLEEDNSTQNKISIKYNGNGGTLSNSDTEIITEVRANSTIILPESSFSYTMYDFVGWADADGNEYQAGDEYQVRDETIEFWAKWKYKIKEELACLITTGNQYIDTGYIPNQDTSIEIQFQLLSRKSQFIYGNRQGQLENTYALVYYNNTDSTKGYEGFRSDYGNNSNQQITTQGYEGIQTIKEEKNKVYINGILKYTHNISTFSTEYPSVNNKLTLFNVNTNGNINNSYSTKCKFYYCKIWDGDTLVRDFIPVVDNNGTICILDKVENKLYYAQYGDIEEEFEREKDITEISSAICDGNQYIDTGFKPNQDTTVEMKFKIDDDNNQALFGARTSQTSKTLACFFLSSTGNIRFDYNTHPHTYYSGYTSGTFYTIKQNKNNFYIDGEYKGGTIYNSFSCDYNLYLFAVNTLETAELNAYVDCCYCKIWDGDTLVRDYVPVLDSRNIVCLYDKVEEKCYYGQGANLIMGMQ